MRIVSLLPSATEILYALGVGDEVVGVTHECDFPPEAARKPALIKPRVDPTAAPDDLATALSRFSRPPRVLTLTPHSLDDVWQDIIRAGEATDTLPRAES